MPGRRRAAKRSGKVWPRYVRVLVALAASAAVTVFGLPAYAAEPGQVTVVSATTLVAVENDSAIQKYSDSSDASANLTRSTTVGLSETVVAAPDSVSLKTACTIDGRNLSGSVAFPMPNNAFQISSGIGWRYVSQLGAADYHTGQDLSSLLKTSIFDVVDGTVTDIGTTLGATYIEVHSVLPSGETVDIYYVHEYPSGVFVSKGQTVYAGEKIAEVGQSGQATGPHLHLEMHDASKGKTTVGSRDNLIDPLTWLESHGAISVGSC